MHEVPTYSEEMPVKLDLKDKKLLFELDFNARMPYSQLARKVGLSKQGAEYKVNNLVRKGVIQGFYPVINVPKLGYLYCRVSVTLKNITKERQSEIIGYLKNHEKVFWLFRMQGIYDLLIVIWAKSVTEYKDFIDELESKFGQYIKNKVPIIATDVVYWQSRYLLGGEETKEIHIKETPERAEIDDLDKKILGTLCENARMPLVEIANKLKQSAKVVAYRIKRMEKEKLIEAYRPVINNNKIGYTYYKLLISMNNVSKEEMKRLKSYIKYHPLAIYLVEGIGHPADLDLEIMVKSNRQLFDFIEELRFKFPAIVGEYQAVIFMETLKVRYLPF